MKPVSPIFIHSQHPMQIFLLSPIWWFLLVACAFVIFLFMQSFMPSVSLLVTGAFFIMSFIVVKVKLGRDRHSDFVFALGLGWRFKHWRGKISAGDKS